MPLYVICPECREPARRRSPTRWTPAIGPTPAWSHHDGEPLCPRRDARGYQPAPPTVHFRRRPATDNSQHSAAWANAALNYLELVYQARGIGASHRHAATTRTQSDHLLAGELAGLLGIPALQPGATAQTRAAYADLIQSLIHAYLDARDDGSPTCSADVGT